MTSLSDRKQTGQPAQCTISHADSRLWRTLRALLFRPGYLSQQFLAGRRARYLSPFRLYFVLSVLFFLMVSITHIHPTPPVNAPASITATPRGC